MSLADYLHAVPKAELHLHLQGSVSPDTLLLLAKRNGVSLPAETPDELRRWFDYRDFGHFLGIYDAICRCLRTAEDYELIAYECGAELARQNVRYAEVTFTPGDHERQNVPSDVYMGGLARGRDRVRRELGVELSWVFDVVRSSPERERLADYVLGVAVEGMADGVVALGLGGGEAGYPPELFAPWFEKALAAGLHSAPHAGEVVGPESIWGAIRALGAERIGHGVLAVEDPTLVAYLVEHRIALEVCPTSNVRLGIYPDLASHPLRKLRDAGVVVTVNSDDPPLFGTTLDDEVALLASAFGYDRAAIDEILLDAVRHSFLPPERRRALEAEFRAGMAALWVDRGCSPLRRAEADRAAEHLS